MMRPATAHRKRSAYHRAMLATAGCGMAASIGFAAIYLQRDRMATDASASDALSIPYLQAQLRAHPADRHLRSALARLLGVAGRWREANAVLQAGEPLPAADPRLRLERLQVQASLAATLTAGAEKTALLRDLDQQLTALHAAVDSPAILTPLAGLADAAGLHRTAGRLWEKIALATTAAADATTPCTDAPGTGLPAPRPAAGIALRRSLDAYLAAGLGADAKRVAVAAAPRARCDADFIERVVVIALAQKDLALAQQFGRLLTRLAPGDAAILARQVEIELAAADPAAAVAPMTALVALAPTAASRRRLASIAEWANHPQFALDQWLLLMPSDTGTDARRNAMRLALSLGQDSLWLQLAAPALQHRRLTPQERVVIREIRLRGHATQALVTFLQPYVQRTAAAHGNADQEPAVETDMAYLLADLHEEQGAIDAALQVLQAVAAHGEARLPAAQRQAQLLLRAGRTEAAWQVLESVRADLTPADPALLDTYATLAWQRGDHPKACAAYQAGWDAGAASPVAAERLITGCGQQGKPDQTIAVATQAHARLGQPRWLLLGMDQAFQAGRWDLLKRLANEARQDETGFAENPAYWLLAAQSARHDGDLARARHAYGKALALQPDALATRLDLLWFEIAAGERQPLAAHLQAWEQDASTQPAYWSAYASAMDALGRHDAALGWYGMLLARTPDDLKTQYDAVQALQAQAGAADSTDSADSAAARRLFAHVKPLVEQRLARRSTTPDAAEIRLLDAYAALLRSRRDEAGSDRVLQAMLAKGADDTRTYMLLVRSSLLRREFGQARQWIGMATGKGHALPAYQPLAVALAADDRPAMAHLLLQRETELSPTDRITTLRRLGRDAQALAVADSALLRTPDERDALLRQRDELRLQLARGFELKATQRTLAQLDVTGVAAAVSLPVTAGRLTLRLAHDLLRSVHGALAPLFASRQEDASIELVLAPALGAARASLGVNRTTGNALGSDTVLHGDAEWRLPLTDGVNARAAFSFNGVADETALLRAIGLKHRASLEIGAVNEAQVYARAEVAAQQFHTRDSTPLARGYHLDAEFGRTFEIGARTWKLRASGAWERSRLAAQDGKLTQAGALLTDFVPGRFATVGVGSTVYFGPLTPSPGAARGTVDAWVGRQWPQSGLAYALRASADLPLTHDDSIRLDAFYNNVQGQLGGRPSHGAAAWYRTTF